jgi:hypothetical protein
MQILLMLFVSKTKYNNNVIIHSINLDNFWFWLQIMNLNNSF